MSEMIWWFQNPVECDETDGHEVVSIPNHLKSVNDICTSWKEDGMWSDQSNIIYNIPVNAIL